MTRTLFHGGHVFDNVGSPPARADVVVESGPILDIGIGLDDDESVELERPSDPLDADGVGMGGERPQIFDVAGEHDAARFRTGNDDGVHRGAALGKLAQLARATSKGGRQVLPNVASLEQTIHCRVIVLAARG
jgi:hypothetical protein